MDGHSDFASPGQIHMPAISPPRKLHAELSPAQALPCKAVRHRAYAQRRTVQDNPLSRPHAARASRAFCPSAFTVTGIARAFHPHSPKPRATIAQARASPAQPSLPIRWHCITRTSPRIRQTTSPGEHSHTEKRTPATFCGGSACSQKIARYISQLSRTTIDTKGNVKPCCHRHKQQRKAAPP